jgi:hypothetical protein
MSLFFPVLRKKDVEITILAKSEVGGLVRKYVYLACNFLIREHAVIVTISGAFVAERFSCSNSAGATS